jgi:hypothetical protein
MVNKDVCYECNITMPKIVILVDMLEPLIDEQFDQSKQNSPMMEILVEFRISISILTQFIIDLGI